MTVFYIILTIVLIAMLAFVILTYNSLKRKELNVDHAIAGLDTYLQQRSDELDEQVVMLERLFVHEDSILKEITAMKYGLERAKNSGSAYDRYEAIRNAENMGLFLREAYPQIVAGNQAGFVAKRTGELEDEINAGRRNANSAITIFNMAIETFPAIILASFLGFERKELFSADLEAREKYSPPYKDAIWKSWQV